MPLSILTPPNFCARLKYRNTIHSPWILQQNSLYRAARFANLEGIWCSVNHFSEGGVNANHNVTRVRPAWQAENDSRLLIQNSEGNRDGEWIFCLRKEAGVTLFLQVTRMKNLRRKLN